jgi:hypothetical protein
VLTGVLGLTFALGSAAGAIAQDATPMASPEAGVVLEPDTLSTSRPYFLASDPAKFEVTPILTSGEMVGDYQFAGTPDGTGAYKDANGDVVLFVNHEWTPKAPGSDEGNISGGRISRLVLDGETGAVKSGSYALDGSEGYWDLCSATLFGPRNGFTNPVFVSGEETTDGPMNGIAFGVDGATGEVTPMPWLGHLHHENQIAIPGFGDKKVVLISDDDSHGSEAYLYVADNEADLMSGAGQLYVFKTDNASGTADIAKGAELTGQFVPIDQKDNADADTLQKAVDAAGAFKLVRMEDADFNPATPNVVYFADTGDNADPNLDANGKPLTANGRIYQMTLDPADPTKVTSFKVLLDGDNGDDIKNPDNVAVSDDGKTLMIQEDRNGYNRAENSDDTGRIFAYDTAAGTITTVGKLDQSDGEGLLDPGDKAGDWETTGIIDVSSIFGPGAWLTAVQAHTRPTPQLGGTDEGGQLLFIRQK